METSLKINFEIIAKKSTEVIGSSKALFVFLLAVIVWAIWGFVAHFSDTWQLVMNTGTTVLTTLIVILIQHSQNKDTAAIQIKLNELIKAIEKADNNKIGIEDLTEDEIIKLKQ